MKTLFLFNSPWVTVALVEVIENRLFKVTLSVKEQKCPTHVVLLTTDYCKAYNSYANEVRHIL